MPLSYVEFISLKYYDKQHFLYNIRHASSYYLNTLGAYKTKTTILRRYTIVRGNLTNGEYVIVRINNQDINRYPILINNNGIRRVTYKTIYNALTET